MPICDTIKERLSLAELIPELQGKAGSRIQINCPLHDDTNASFTYYPVSNTWYCFGCTKGSSVIDYVMAAQKIDLDQAIRWCSDSLGLKKEVEESEVESEKLLKLRSELLTEITTYCQKRLSTSNQSATAARDYIASRNWSEDVVANQQLGMVDVPTIGRVLGLSEEDLQICGLWNGDKPISREPRLWIPFIEHGKVVHAQLRSLKAAVETHKYVNLAKNDTGATTRRWYNADVIHEVESLIIVEGPADCLTALSMGMPAIATIGKVIPSTKPLRGLKRIFVVPDNDPDEGGLTHAKRMAAEIRKTVPKESKVFITELPKTHKDVAIKDLSDWYKAGATLLDFNELEHQEILPHEPEPTEDVNLTAPQRIHKMRTSRKGNEYSVNAQIYGTILEDLKTSGARFFYDPLTDIAYIFRDHVLIPIGESIEIHAFLSTYTINPKDKLFQYVMSGLRVEAHQNGCRVNVHVQAFYNRNTYTLYLSSTQHQFYVITGNTIKLCDNGTDEVFLTPQAGSAPFVYDHTIADANELFESIVLGQINFREDALTSKQKRMLFDLTIRFYFFPQIAQTRPIVTLIGDHGSGKSSTWRRILKVIFGPKADLYKLDSEESFCTIASNNFISIFDNVDSGTKWINELLSVVATGGYYSKRELYSTNSMAEYPLSSVIGLTSQKPHFRDPAVADRLMILHTERFEVDEADDGGFYSESTMIEEIAANRPALVKAFVDRLQLCIKALEATAHITDKSLRSNFRMADFASFALRYAITYGFEAEMRGIFKTMVGVQSDFVFEGDQVFEFLMEYAQTHPAEPHSATEIFTALSDKYKDKLPLKNAVWMSRYINEKLPNLKSYLRITIDIEKHTKHKTYAFTLAEQPATKPNPAPTLLDDGLPAEGVPF